MRASIASSVGRRQLVVGPARAARPPRRALTGSGSSCTSSDRTPGGDVDDGVVARGRPASGRGRGPGPAGRGRAPSAPYSTSTKASPDRRTVRAGPVAGRRPGGRARRRRRRAGAVSGRLGAAAPAASRRPCGVRRRRSDVGPVGRRAGTNAHLVARGELAQLPPLGRHHGGRAGEAAEAGPVGAEQHRRVAGEVDGAEGVAGVVDVRRVQARPRRRRAGPSAGRGPSRRTPVRAQCDLHPPLAAKKASTSAAVKKSGAACGPFEHADAPRAGRSRASAPGGDRRRQPVATPGRRRRGRRRRRASGPRGRRSRRG